MILIIIMVTLLPNKVTSMHKMFKLKRVTFCFALKSIPVQFCSFTVYHA